MPHDALARVEEPVTEDSALAQMGGRIGRLSVDIAEIAAIVGDLAQIGERQNASAVSVVDAARQMNTATGTLAEMMAATRATAEDTRRVLNDEAGAIGVVVRRNAETMSALSTGALTIQTSLRQIDDIVQNVGKTSAAIGQIARETKLLALNASVEAARAGDAGRGFAIIADAVKTLADQIHVFSGKGTTDLLTLTTAVAQLQVEAGGAAETAQSAIAETAAAEQAAIRLGTLVGSVDSLVKDIDRVVQPVEQSVAGFARVQESLTALVETVEHGQKHLKTASARTSSVLNISDELLGLVAENGIAPADAAIIEHAQDVAAHIASLMTVAVAKGELSMADLFDEDYRPIPGTNPQQYLNRYTAFADRVIAPVQEAVLSFDKKVVFCNCADRKGYVAAHNREYSKPQGTDPVWNAAHCRNRRIYNDRSFNACMASKQPYLLLSYRRDMGGGQFAMMKYCGVPIVVNGRRWGIFSLGFPA